jgi:probable addiction module antidote protein
MSKRTRPYREALLEALADPNEVVHYVNAALEDSPEMFLKALRNVAQARHQMAHVAKQAGVARESVYRALSSEGNPRLDTLHSILHALGLDIKVAAKEPVQRVASGGAAYSPHGFRGELNLKKVSTPKIRDVKAASVVSIISSAGSGKTAMLIAAITGINVHPVLNKQIDLQQSGAGTAFGQLQTGVELGSSFALAPLDCVIAAQHKGGLIRKYGSSKKI